MTHVMDVQRITKRPDDAFCHPERSKGSLPGSTGILRFAQNDSQRRPNDLGHTRILFERHGQINLRLNDNLPQAELAVVGLRRAG